AVVGNLFHEDFLVAHRVRPRSDQVHLATENVYELRQLVDTESPEKTAESGDAIKVSRHPLRPVHFRRMHRPELDQAEGLSVLAGAILEEQNGSARIELDGERDQSEKRREQDKTTDDRTHASQTGDRA